ncbi:hypothetical protein A6A04_19670 [Paramagnetospirillum marisnigri]|uniref:Uncharacterized protein n=1 Tax=Paramagnetospirillum marisnigri TaxID=1285242 RepID=A0A178MJG2_9PROT|nr:hypothetical protein A6A04_19670 [Paramagnetospirillum marisnigri]
MKADRIGINVASLDIMMDPFVGIGSGDTGQLGVRVVTKGPIHDLVVAMLGSGLLEMFENLLWVFFVNYPRNEFVQSHAPPKSLGSQQDLGGIGQTMSPPMKRGGVALLR